MLTVCWALKGGSGTTVVSCAIAMTTVQRHPTLLIDLAGDAPAALGITEPTGPGVHDWLASPAAPATALDALTTEVDGGLRLLTRGRTMVAPDHPRWAVLSGILATSAVHTIIDLGTIGPATVPPRALVEAAQQRLLVTRACYLALRKVGPSDLRPTGVVIVREPGRALHAIDVEHAVGAPVVAEVAVDPAVCRAVDAGLVLSRVPRALLSAIGGLAA